MKLPHVVNICGIQYSITYVDKPSEVDIHKRESLWGQIDYWTHSIRVFDDGQPAEEVFRSLFHEVLHGIGTALHLNEFNKDENHDELDVLALAVADVLFRNGWLEVER